VETLVSAKGAKQGELLDFRVEEGMRLQWPVTPVGVIDTTLLVAPSFEDSAANREAIASQARNVVAAVAVQDARWPTCNARRSGW
jgi:hypothetical protein